MDVALAPSAPGDQGEIEVRLPPAARAHGRVTDAEGKPVAGATVRLGDRYGLEWDGPVARTQQDGTYTLEAVDGSKPFVVEASHEGSAPARLDGLSAGPGEALSGVDLALGPVGRIRGTVREDSYRNVAGAKIHVYKLCNDLLHDDDLDLFWRRPEVISDANGSFELDSLPAGRYRVVAETADHRIAEADWLRLEPGDTLPVLLRLGPMAFIRGRALDSRGTGVAGLRVRVRATGDSFAPGLPSSTTDEDGRYELGPLPAGDRSIEISAGDRNWRARRDVQAPAEGVNFAVPLDSTVVGRVVRATDRQPVQEFWVAADTAADRMSLRRWSARPFLSKDGSFVMEGLPSGLLSVRIWAPGLASGGVQGVRGRGGQIADAGVVQLSPESWIAGRVLDARGAPVPGAAVELDRGDEDASNRFDHEATGKTDARGEYVLVGLGAGPVRLRASARDALSAPVGVELTGGRGRRGVDLHLGGEIVLRGRIVDGAQGPAVAGARVAVDVPLGSTGPVLDECGDHRGGRQLRAGARVRGQTHGRRAGTDVGRGISARRGAGIRG